MLTLYLASAEVAATIHGVEVDDLCPDEAILQIVYWQLIEAAVLGEVKAESVPSDVISKSAWEKSLRAENWGSWPAKRYVGYEINGGSQVNPESLVRWLGIKGYPIPDRVMHLLSRDVLARFYEQEQRIEDRPEDMRGARLNAALMDRSWFQSKMRKLHGRSELNLKMLEADRKNTASS